MTLDEFNQHENWPTGSAGFRLPGGRVVWTNVRYTEGGSVGRMQVSRIVHKGGQVFTRCSYPDPYTPMVFVDAGGEPLPDAARVICENCGGDHPDGERGTCTAPIKSAPCGACHACVGECGDLFADDVSPTT